MADSEKLTCYKHPTRETLLRCNKCERPICTECAVLTPTGYRCKECVRGQQKVFNNAKAADYIISIVVGAGLAFIGSYIPSFLGFFTIFAAPFAGTLIGTAISKLTGSRRAKSLFNAATIAVVLGSLPLLIARLLPIFGGFMGGSFNLFGLLPLIWQAVYTFLLTGSFYYRLTGIKIG